MTNDNTSTTPYSTTAPLITSVAATTSPSGRDVCDTLRAELAANPGGILEMTAVTHGVTLQAAITCLPTEMWRIVPGTCFIDALQDIADWGEVTTVVHTRDVIMEFEGAIPAGSTGRGFYNLQGDGGLSGHLRADRCGAIAFVRRPFMGTHTLSVQFLNTEGEAMFKVFVGRDPQRRLKAGQVARFDALEARLIRDDD